MNKKLIIIRHAHRDKIDNNPDNGLSPKGEKQARNLKKFFKKTYCESPELILTSPKKRCRETVAPLLKKSLAFKVSPLLDEGAPLEQKVSAFIQWWGKNAPSFTVVCSHGDWVPLCVQKLTGQGIELKKGGLIEIQSDGKNVLLNAIIQEP